MITILAVAAGLYALMLLYLYSFQGQLIFHPGKDIHPPQAYGLEGFDERFIEAGGERLQLWYRPARPGLPLVVYFHGNASHLGNRAPKLAALAAKGFGVLGLSYRGYGKSTGEPSEQGLFADARATLAYAAAELHAPAEKLVLFGESLGSGVAVAMAAEHNVAAVALEAPYTSVAARAGELYPYVPVELLLKHKFDSLSRITQMKAPLLIFHGEKDATIPVEHGKALLAAANEPKKAVFFPHVGHNDFDDRQQAEMLLEFLESNEK